MSSQHHPGLPGGSAAATTGVQNSNSSSSTPKDSESSRALHSNTIEPKTLPDAPNGANWSKTNHANDPLPPQQATISDAQSDAGSASSSGSQTDEGTSTRRRTRNHYTRSKSNDGQENGDGQPDIRQVSTILLRLAA